MSGVNSLLWVFTIVLAVVFTIDGIFKTYRYETGRKLIPWFEKLPRMVVMTIGLFEIVAAAAMVVPAATGSWLWLSTAASGALMILMLMAFTYQLMQHDSEEAATPALLMIMLGVVTYLRMAMV